MSINTASPASSEQDEELSSHGRQQQQPHSPPKKRLLQIKLCFLQQTQANPTPTN
jgi:hypothetical protein